MSVLDNFNWWCQKVLPLVYDDSLSYYEVLCKLTQIVKELAKDEQNLEDTFNQFKSRQDELEQQFQTLVVQWAAYKNQMDNNFAAFQQQYQGDFSEFQSEVKAELQQMADILDQIKNGDYVNLYLDSIKNYIDNNLQQLVAGIVSYVSFGLDNTGHFVAYIPETWDFIKFDTIQEGDLYGHLVLQW